MSRISSLAANTNLIQQMLRTQQRVFDLQTQVNSEKKSQDYAGIARNSERLVNIENSTALLNRFVENNEREQTRLNIAASAVDGIRTSIRNFQKDLSRFNQSGATTEPEVNAIQDSAFRALRDMEDLLNTEVDGRFVFAGGKTTTQPMNFGYSSAAAFKAAFDGAIITVPTTRDAHLEEFEISSDDNNRNKKFIDGSNFLRFERDSDGNTTTAGTSTIRATSDVFSNLSVGATIEITNTTSNNGTYTVSAISSDGQTVTVRTEMLTDETMRGRLADEAPAPGAVSFLLEDGSTVTSGAGDITFDRLAGTIVDGGGGSLFSGVTAGDFITVSGSGSNNGTYQVQSVNSADSVTIARTPTTVATPDGSVSLDNDTTGSLTFSRSGDTITAGNADAFADISVGQAITINGTDENDGTYTVASNDGTTITIESKKLTDEGLTGNTFFDYFGGTELVLDDTNNTLTVREYDAGGGTGTPVENVFKNLQVGDELTLAGAADGANNTTYTIASIASDGSSVTFDSSVTFNSAETIATDGTLTGNGNGFSYSSGTQVDFVDNGGGGANTIQIQDSGGTAIPGVFSDLTVGETITVSGTDVDHDDTYTITAISSNGSQITVAEAFPNAGGNLTDTDGVEFEVFATGGTVAASSYFDGDNQAVTHRVDKDRDFEFDVNAASPGFEKAIRAMKLILQGEYGTEGGLDQNMDRVQDAIYLIGASLESTVTGTPPFGTEETGSIEQIQQDIGFNQFLVNEVNKQHKDFIGFLEASAADVENADPLDSVTRLLDDQRALQASYQAFARIRQLSLTNFL